MSRFAALLCLSIAGCSHQAPPPETAEVTSEPVATAAPGTNSEWNGSSKLQPASLEGKGSEARDTTSQPQVAPPPAKAEAPSTIPPRAGTETSTQTDTTKSTAAATDTTKSTQPDNTKVNERDRNSAALTPVDQGNGESDLKLTQQIRQAVMSDKSLSFTAKNVKIITKDGKVTLRGPVKTAEERAAIEAHARRVAGSSPIDNQIEVKK